MLIDPEQHELTALLARLPRKEACRVVARRLFTLHDEQRFFFFYYPESADELRDYVAAKWRHTHLAPATHRQAVEAVNRHPEGRLWLREQVRQFRWWPSCDPTSYSAQMRG